MREAPKAELPPSRKRPASTPAASLKLKQKLLNLNGASILISDDEDADDPPVTGRRGDDAPQQDAPPQNEQDEPPQNQQEDNRKCQLIVLIFKWTLQLDIIA